MGKDALIAARSLAAKVEPLAAARRCSVGYEGGPDRGRFTIPFLGREIRIGYPEFDVLPPGGLPDHVAALIVYHLGTSDGTKPSGRWVSFADLPDGEFYATAFRGYTGAPIARRFGTDRPALAAAVTALGGEPLEGLGDAAWQVTAFPQVPVALLFWDADDEFEARAELLFDETALNHLPLDGCAVLGSWLTAMLSRHQPEERT